MSYDVITDNEHWFTLRVNAVRAQGSSDEMLRYYHINKDTNQVVTLSSLFPQGSDYVTVLSQQVKSWLEGREDAFFYQELPPLTPSRALWGRTDLWCWSLTRGSVLPASSGNPEVTIPAQVVQQLMDGA